MTIHSLNLIKDIETKINGLNQNNLKSIRERIDLIETKLGSYIATQLRNQLWKQARAIELI